MLRKVISASSDVISLQIRPEASFGLDTFDDVTDRSIFATGAGPSKLTSVSYKKPKPEACQGRAAFATMLKMVSKTTPRD